MKRNYSNIRATALLLAFMIAFGSVLSGCGIRRVTHKGGSSEASTDGIIHIGDSGAQLEGETEIVIGSDGQSYLVDGEGNSIVYDAVYPNGNSGSVAQRTIITTTTAKVNKATTTAKPQQPTTTKKPETPTTTKQDIRSILVKNRQYADNSAFTPDPALRDLWTCRIYLDLPYDGNYLMIQLWKGSYGSDKVGCEMGLFSAPENETNKKLFEKNPDEIKFSRASDLATDMKIVLYRGSEKLTQASIEHGTWVYALTDGSSSSDLRMACTMPSLTKRLTSAIADALAEKGFDNDGTGKSADELKRSYSASENSIAFSW